MKLALPITAVIGSALLAGCANLSAVTPGVLDGTRAFAAAEAAYDAALQTADNAIETGQLSAATVTKIRVLADAGHAYVLAGRSAVTAANTADLATETAALTTLVAQIAALTKG